MAVEYAQLHEDYVRNLAARGLACDRASRCSGLTAMPTRSSSHPSLLRLAHDWPRCLQDWKPTPISPP